MVKTGKINSLKVTDEFPFGFYLRSDAQEPADEAVLLPKDAAPEHCQVGQQLDVFVYHDSDDRLVATTDLPYAQLGDVACLKVKAITKVGAFLDWGLPKDLLVPFSEQASPMAEGLSYVVYIFQDQETGRLAASSRLRRFLSEYNDDFIPRQAVSLRIYGKSPMGYKAVINDTHLGLIFKDEVFKPLRIGDEVDGFIKRIRDDGKIDLCFQFHDKAARKTLAEEIIDDLVAHGGVSTLTDKSAPEEIQRRFGVSKGAYKKALGTLYKNKQILLDKSSIKLAVPNDINK